MNLYPNYAQRKKCVLLLSLLFLVVSCRFSYAMRPSTMSNPDNTQPNSDNRVPLFPLLGFKKDLFSYSYNGTEVPYRISEVKTNKGSFFMIGFLPNKTTDEEDLCFLNISAIPNARVVHYEHEKGGEKYPCIGIVSTDKYEREEEAINFACWYDVPSLYHHNCNESKSKLEPSTKKVNRKECENLKELTSSSLKWFGVNALISCIVSLFLGALVYFTYKAFFCRDYDHWEYYGLSLPFSVAEQLACHLHFPKCFSYVFVCMIGLGTAWSLGSAFHFLFLLCANACFSPSWL